MHQTTSGQYRLKQISYAVSLALAALVAGNVAWAQEKPTEQPTETATQTGEMTTVVVSTRRSQQSGIERKKNAATAIDSIVAEDVGSLPDRNIGEAISRMSGVALDRGDFGEGVTVAVRGNSPDLTRVEIDGQAVQSANNTGSSGRATEFRQLSADLIKSVDVVKGSTADMVEGSLGGGIVIKTRTGLDFKEPFVSVRVAGTNNNLNKKWQPDTNVILSRKFLDNRLGVILNASKSTLANEQHQMQVATSSAQGYARAIDFDNSPEKTFTFNPSTLNMDDPASTTPIGTGVGSVGIFPYTTGTGSYSTHSPLEILTMSAAAKTKADCYAAFPQLTTGDASLKNISSSNRTTAVNARQNELITCLNQWNDYTPSLIRNRITRENDKRQDLDLRADFKVNNELTVYAKGSYSKRATEKNTSYLNLGGLNTNVSKTYVDTNGVRTVAPGATGYYLYPGNPSYVSGVPTQGTVANVDPASVKVDSSHHVTSFTFTDGSAGVDQIYMHDSTVTNYFQTGGTWRHGPLLAEFLVGDARSRYSSESFRTSFSANYGSATLSVQPNGLWSYTFPQGTNFNLYNAANYVTLAQPDKSSAVSAGGTFINAVPAYSQAQQPLLTNSQPQLTYDPKVTNTEERTAKADFRLALPKEFPFLTRLKSGINFRDTRYDSWGGGGYQQNTSPNVYVNTALVRSTLVGCQDTAGSLGAGGNKCQYGYVPSNRYDSQQSGTVTVTPAQLQDMIAQSLSGNMTNTSLFSGAKGQFGGAATNWPNIDVQKLFALTGAPNFNMNCIYTCLGTDGKTYAQPVTRMSERSAALYLMGDYTIDHIPFTSRSLPFGWEIDGNIGYRYVRTKVHGVGNMAFQSITRTAAFDPANPNAPAGINDVTVSTNTAVDATTHDFLPIYNAAMWVVPNQVVVRYNRARNVARPPVTRMLPSGLCRYDERVDAAGTQTCTKTVGNPALQAQKNLNQNWSTEYYPNKDTMFSLSYFKQQGIVGASLVQTVNGTLGLALVDPTTGKVLTDLPFSFPTYENGVPTTRTGYEFGTKTAFTFLPWRLKYLGFDGNYTKLGSVTSTQNIVDLLSGTPMPPLRESKFQYNWAVWYDDGRFQARVAVQGVASYFNNIAGSSSNYINNYPNASGNARPPAYNPGSPNFKDATRYIDAKISYKISRNFEVFAEGRNLGNATTSNSQGSYVPFADGTPSILDYSYAGRKMMVGVNYRN
ncbi:TonB-dependent receptor [Massilia horti]|uniref:TonB-dependent receptor n=1 Tax=Massilia horti TaxID=2562153 RepID=A0A4Y9T5X0_9BURK|nr:TonB-dependent receptor [Massilia horti]TFW32688.1 TonB-dependent receptor [Massilia horti]